MPKNYDAHESTYIIKYENSIVRAAREYEEEMKQKEEQEKK